MKYYVAGPMTGYPGLNFDEFHSVTRHLRRDGHEVVNPAEINPDLNADWTECMIEDIKQLKTCDAIMLLPNWWESFGAQIEHLVAQKLGLTIEYYDNGQ